MPSTIVSLLGPSFPAIAEAINNDGDFKASANGVNVQFAINSADGDDLVVVSVDKGVASLSQGSGEATAFTLHARAEDWKSFFQTNLVRPYQSYWGMLRILGAENGVKMSGDVASFGRYCRLWRIALDRARDIVTGNQIQSTDYIPPEEMEDDSIIGRYIWVDLPVWGRSKIFYESAGSGPRDILLLHTAGADSRQNHSLMNNKQLQRRCTMYAFDLPAHGRSLPGNKQSQHGFVNSEEPYVEAIGAVIRKLKLKSPIVSGASMAGQVCIAVAMRAKELGVGGVIPLEGCDHIPFNPPIYEMAPDGNESVLNPERVCGMIAPTAPEYYKRLIWWIYSSQGVGIFPGDLKFYFNGWDGRSRLGSIDTSICPVYMLTGEYDYSCTAETSEATAKKISGAKFEKMKGLGHFPNTEHPDAFLPYFLRALDFIAEQHKSK